MNSSLLDYSRGRKSPSFEVFLKLLSCALPRSAGLHIPETYLAALVQAACRAKGWPLDRSTLYTQARTRIRTRMPS